MSVCRSVPFISERICIEHIFIRTIEPMSSFLFVQLLPELFFVLFSLSETKTVFSIIFAHNCLLLPALKIQNYTIREIDIIPNRTNSSHCAVRMVWYAIDGEKKI